MEAVVSASEPDIIEAVSSMISDSDWRALGTASRGIQVHARPPSLVIAALFVVRRYAVILAFANLGIVLLGALLETPKVWGVCLPWRSRLRIDA